MAEIANESIPPLTKTIANSFLLLIFYLLYKSLHIF
jgi:hypothetical protein